MSLAARRYIAGASLFHIASWNMPVVAGFVAYIIGTFVFYWWHRARHAKGLWLVFHQIHHSPSRVEIFTSFYKHPLEILTGSVIQAILLFPILGASPLGMLWYNFFAATGEYFYHANMRSPHWLRYIIQTPELHSIHHQLDVHSFNFSDLPIWDKLFGTYRDTLTFAERCGFPGKGEERLKDMLLFRDVYNK